MWLSARYTALCFTLLYTLVDTGIAQAKTGLDPLYATPKNIILMVGDGMGPAYTSAFRYYQDNPDTQELEQTVFDRLLVGQASTYSLQDDGISINLVTDSAAAATALATGEKSYNGAISVDAKHQALPTLFELAKKQKKAIGIAVTSQINHATPAAFLSHDPHRKNYDIIAKQYLSSQADLLLGGGLKYFAPHKAAFLKQGYQWLESSEQLSTLQKLPAIGLFAEVGLPWRQDRAEHTLVEMTDTALRLLSQQPQGFVLLVEGSQIDWAGHGNDIAAAMAEMSEFAATIELVAQFVRQHPDTLLVITADHSTGGMTLGRDGEYRWQPDVLKMMQGSTEYIAKKLLADQEWQLALPGYLGFTPSPNQWQQLQTSYQQASAQQQEKPLVMALRALMDQQSNTGWTTSGHTGVDVGVYATGAGAGAFQGQQDNAEIGQKLQQLLRPTR